MDKLLGIVPFLAVSCDKEGRPKLNFARIMELVIAIACMYYAMSLQMTKLEVKMDNVEKQVSIMEQRQYEHYTIEKKVVR